MVQMPRKQGIGMRRPKKSKPAVVDEALIEQSVNNAIEAAATIVGDAIPSDPQVIQSDEYDQPYQPTAQDWAGVRHQAACDAFRQSEKYYKKVDAAAKLARRLHDAKCRRILANQMRAPVEKRWRYVDKLQELWHELSHAQICSLRANVFMEQKAHEATACQLRLKSLEIASLRRELRKLKSHKKA